MNKYYASKTKEIEPREKAHMELSRELAGECMVLLENDGVLPLKTTGRLALYGQGARHTVKGGTGSGDVNSRMQVSVEQGLKEAGFQITTMDWLARQEEKYKADKEKYMEHCQEKAEETGKPVFIIAFDDPYREPAPTEITDDDVIKSDTDTAIYVIARNAGEGCDRYVKPGDYDLYAEELENLRKLTQSCAKVIVVLNIGGIINLTQLKAVPGIHAILLMNQLGNIGGHALADVITGNVNPSGKTVDTWAKQYMDYPSSRDFSHNGNVLEEYYTEGIYVGYRYFDTFQVKPEYCFGFGRSYTTFDIQTDNVVVDGSMIRIKLRITNTGSEYAGKEVVQVYYSAEQSGLDKPYQELAAYQKTGLLAPGQKQETEINIKVEQLASYDETKAAYVIEQGDYLLRVGNSAENTEIIAVLNMTQDVLVQTGKNLFAMDCQMEEIKPHYLPEREQQELDQVPHYKIDANAIETRTMQYHGKREEYHTNQTKLLTIEDVKSGQAAVEELVAQLTIKEMAELCVGTLRLNNENVVGSASCNIPGAAGDTSAIIEASRGVKNMVMADGPAGLRLQPHFRIDETDYYQYCTAIPIGWALAQSWNDHLVEMAGDMIGREMEQFHVDLWLAPALNIHRNPLCGRNFEYYSEDPLVAGKMAAAMTKGVQKHAGKGTTIKHFAVNNQEDNRYFVNAHVGERALREIYLKGFEIAVKEAQPFSIMTSYNLLNGVHTANNHSLIQGMARDEWGFHGVVMTDWFTSQDQPGITGKYHSSYPISASTGCIYAGNDIQMPGCQKNVDDIIEAVTSGRELDGYRITLADLQFNAANVIRVAARMQ